MRSWLFWGGVLGFALGGFFDGILLHQILQWHHLLSLVPGLDLRVQILWDGYFHALMYLLAALGLWKLWRTWPAETWSGVQRSLGPALSGAMLAGFGLWHVVDGLVSHWLLGIHRIRLDSTNPLMWDILWFAGFGIVPLLAGWFLLRRPRAPRGGDAREGPLTLLSIALLVTGMAGWSLRPPPGQAFTTVVFGPGVRPGQVIDAIREADGGLAWSNPGMSVVVVAGLSPGNSLRFYAHGALLVGGSGLPSGCFNWSRA